MPSVLNWGWITSTSTRALPMRMQSSNGASEPMRRNASSCWTNPHKTISNSTPGTSPTYTPTTLSAPIWALICLPLRRLSSCTLSRERLSRGWAVVNRAGIGYHPFMRGHEFVARLKRIGKIRGVDVFVNPEMGKGSHMTLYYGRHLTTLKDPRKEIGPGLLSTMIRQPGLTRKDFR